LGATTTTTTTNIKKEIIVPLVAGGLVTGGIDGVIEMVYASNTEKWSGKFPFIPTIEPLPPLDDWIVLAVPLVALGVGHITKKEAVKNFGIGGLIYAGAMFLHHIIMNTRRMVGIKFDDVPIEFQVRVPIIKEI